MNPSIPTGGAPIVVSIVVAGYNAEKFIHKCVDSLLSQTYPHLEVILVTPDKEKVQNNLAVTKEKRIFAKNKV